MTYNPGQAKRILSYLETPPNWLILGGPADADEAQYLKGEYPGLKVIAVEPCLKMIDWQRANGFPVDGIIFQAALMSEAGVAIMTESPNGRCSTLVRDRGEQGDAKVIVSTITLDSLLGLVGPFKSAILWLDIEGAELEALRGASILLASGQAQLINVEMMADAPERNRLVDELLRKNGYVERKQWGRWGGNYDSIYTKEPL